MWCWRWRNKEGAAAVVVVLESCHQQRGQHHQQQRPEPAPRCSRSCGISSSTDVGSWKSSLPSSAIRSRTGRPWGARQETNLSIKAGADTLHCAHLWVEGVAWAGVGGECLRLRDASTVKSLSSLCARCWPQITTELEHLRHSAALPGECRECS